MRSVARLRGIVPAGLLVLCLAIPAEAQDSTGTVDTRGDVANQIRTLEMMIGGDVAAEKQAVTLRWLADLYVLAGRLDDAQRAYERILVFYPNDVASNNAYAEFLLEHKHNPARADSTLRAALAWDRAAPVHSSYLGRTYALLARALRDRGRCDEALTASEKALGLLDEDSAEDALRVRAGCLTDLGRRDDAHAAYLLLIGETAASRADDVNAFIALASGPNHRVDAATVQGEIAAAIDSARANRRKAAAAEGATIVELDGADHVRLEGTLRGNGKDAAILFVPDIGERRVLYTPYAQLLSIGGITTLTIDLRGQGDSRCDTLPDFEHMSPDQRDRLPDDVATAYDFLRTRTRLPETHIAIVASGEASEIVERALHDHALEPAVVHLSPIFDPADRDLASALSFHPPRPALAVASREDVYAVRSLELFAASVDSGLADTRVYDAAGHGVDLLRDPGRFDAISRWLDRVLGLSR
jgi:tetratricopeptide (TPR) repeat protein